MPRSGTEPAEPDAGRPDHRPAGPTRRHHGLSVAGRPDPAHPGPRPPAYGAGSVGAIMPGIAAALGVPTALPAAAFPQATSVCLVLIDGLGAELLEQAGVDARFLGGFGRSAGPFTVAAGSIDAGCPTTTATSMGSLGTGLPPGRHGLLGYEVMDPDRGELLNELKWHPDTDPMQWQPHPTLFTGLADAGVAVTRVGNPEFVDSGLTTAAQRGGEFIGAKRLHARVDAAVDVLAGPQRAMAYLYWGDVDAAGHAHGWQSSEWRRALRQTDRELSRLARRLRPGTLLVIVADHGMVDVPLAARIDLADRPDLASGVRILGGEPRFAQAYCEPGAAPAVARRWAAEFGDRAWVRTRSEAIAAGWFGPVDPGNLGRLGDVIVAAAGAFVLVDSRTASPNVLKLIGQHGSLTPAEQRVPLLAALV